MWEDQAMMKLARPRPKVFPELSFRSVGESIDSVNSLVQFFIQLHDFPSADANRKSKEELMFSFQSWKEDISNFVTLHHKLQLCVFHFPCLIPSDLLHLDVFRTSVSLTVV